jgi:acetoin utilization protein AcuB
MHRTLVRDIMTPDPVSIDPDLRITVAIETMNSQDVRRLPVISSTGYVIGVISRNDALIALPRAHGGLATTVADVPYVKEVMSDYVYKVGPDDSIARAAQMMVNHEISCLPVLDETKKMIGIVTESDIFKFVASHLPSEDDAG